MKSHSKIHTSPESETVEWKQSLGEWREIVETCTAFATAKGGRILIGVDPKGTVCGVQIGKGTLEDLTNKIVQNTSPRQMPGISTSVHDKKTIILVAVKESKIKPGKVDAALRKVVELNERQKKGWAFVRAHKRMTRREYQDHVQTSLPTAKRDLEQMKRLGLLIRRSSGPSSYYEAGSGKSDHAK